MEIHYRKSAAATSGGIEAAGFSSAFQVMELSGSAGNSMQISAGQK
jgi:hypothetical protein